MLVVVSSYSEAAPSCGSHQAACSRRNVAGGLKQLGMTSVTATLSTGASRLPPPTSFRAANSLSGARRGGRHALRRGRRGRRHGGRTRSAPLTVASQIAASQTANHVPDLGTQWGHATTSCSDGAPKPPNKPNHSPKEQHADDGACRSNKSRREQTHARAVPVPETMSAAAQVRRLPEPAAGIPPRRTGPCRWRQRAPRSD